MHVDDLGQLCLELGGRTDNVTVDAAGPESPTFRELVTAIKVATGRSYDNQLTRHYRG
jgi:hypothetical protein